MMVRCALGLAGAFAFALMSGCGEAGRDGFSDAEWTLIRTLSPVPQIEYDQPAAELGQRLFWEPDFAGPLAVGSDLGDAGECGRVACASCHVPDTWFIDSRSRPNATSLGVNWTGRNTPTAVNAVFHNELAWHGKFADMVDLIESGPLFGAALMASEPCIVVDVVVNQYAGDYDQVFPDTPIRPELIVECADSEDADQVIANVGIAIDHYTRRLVSRNAPFDRFVAGDSDAISERAKRGLKLFIGDALCVECHNGPTFSDDRYYRTGVPQDGTDGGRCEVTEDPADCRAFRTPGLRNVAHTAPYMHTGQFATLADVLDFYWRGGTGDSDHYAITALDDLTVADLQDLEAFLDALTGDPIPEVLREDTANPQRRQCDPVP